MDHHRDQDVDERRPAEHQRHHVDRQPAGLERPDDARRARGAERAGDGCSNQPAGVKRRQTALGGQRDDRDDHADQKIGDADAE